MASQDFGYNNYLTNNNNSVYGSNSRAIGQNQLVYGMYNVDASSDVSTDLLHFGVGVEGNPRTLIRVDENGTVYFNGSELPLEGGSGSVVEVTSDTTALESVNTYLVDTSGGDVTMTLPIDVAEGKQWNFKKMDSANTLTVIGDDDGAGSTYPIDEDASGVTVLSQYDNITIKKTNIDEFIIV